MNAALSIEQRFALTRATIRSKPHEPPSIGEDLLAAA